MHHSLKTPWLRTELLHVLRNLADLGWLSGAMDDRGRPDQELAAAYDFLDDTGVLDTPTGRVGYVLLDEEKRRRCRIWEPCWIRPSRTPVHPMPGRWSLALLRRR